MRSLGLPHSRSTQAAVPTTGVAVAIPDGSVAPFFPATQVKVAAAADVYIGWGEDNTPPTAAEGNTVLQQGAAGGAEEVYALPTPPDPMIDFLYIYAVAATVDCEVSFFG